MSIIPNQPQSGDSRPVTTDLTDVAATIARRHIPVQQRDTAPAARNGHQPVPELITRFFTAITDAGMFHDFSIGMALGEQHAAAGTVDQDLVRVFDNFTARGSKVDPGSVRLDLFAGGYYLGRTYAELQAAKASR